MPASDWPVKISEQTIACGGQGTPGIRPARAKCAFCVERSKIVVKSLLRKAVRERTFLPSHPKARAFARIAHAPRRTTRPVPPGFWLGGLIAVALLSQAAAARAAEIDLANAVVVTPAARSIQEEKAIELLVEEVQKRTRIQWRVSAKWPAANVPVIAVGQNSSQANIAGPFAARIEAHAAPKAAEGFRIFVEKGERLAPAIFVIGNDPRGMLFGVGRLLRELRMGRDKVSLPEPFEIATSPKYPLRGHQLGYRPKTNSYDGWSLPMWEQYIRDLIVFGTNAIELIPPRSDDAADSPHFPLPPMEMMIGMSKLCADYGLDVWIWYPAMDADYSDPRTVEKSLKEWGEVFRKLPRIDAIFVPGGDPGHTKPSVLMTLLEKQTENLHRFHPKAQMWVSPQSFSQEWLDEFVGILNKEQPKWLSGVVHGPQVRVNVSELRKLVPANYPIRRYPDITHSVRCEYPVPDWDVAYALTEAREVINPRPVDEAKIFHAYEKDAIGFLCYSEGCNDDVNKIIWSSLGWDPHAKIPDILREYSRYFLGDRNADDFAQGLLSLERNWRGPIRTNDGILTTLEQFRSLEKRATPQELLDWRFQQALYRAYYDAYEHRRSGYEADLEDRAMDRLRAARDIGSLKALDDAEAILDRTITNRVAGDLRARVFELAEALFQSIRMQLSVERYKAISVGRGANLDTIDVPLNNRNWLKKRFAEVRKLDSDEARLKEIDAIVHWTDPGPGGFYDELGNPSRRPHLVRGTAYAKDPAFYQSPFTGFNSNSSWRLSWCRHVETLYDTPLKMRYTGLDPSGRYKIRIVYAGDVFRNQLRLVANGTIEVHPWIGKNLNLKPVEFEIPPAATRGGELNLTWTQNAGRGGNGRGCQIAEVWLIKNGSH